MFRLIVATTRFTIAVTVLLAMVVEALTRTRSIALHIRFVETIERDLAIVAHFDDLDLYDITDIPVSYTHLDVYKRQIET